MQVEQRLVASSAQIRHAGVLHGKLDCKPGGQRQGGGGEGGLDDPKPTQKERYCCRPCWRGNRSGGG